MARSRRILFVTPPGYGHTFPVVPLAWAARSAGHDVCVATCGVSTSACVRAGLPVINVGPGVDLPALFKRHAAGFASQASPVFVELCEATVEQTIEAARQWRADLLVYTPDAVGAVIAATELRLPSVFLGVGLSYTPALMFSTLYATVADTVARRGLTALNAPSAWIDVAPPSLRTGASDGWLMQTISYSGGTMKYAAETGSRGPGSRVAVTLGTIVPMVSGVEPLRTLMCAAAKVDATFVLAHGMANGKALEPLPANVQGSAWIALEDLFADSRAVIHHGGSGTTLAALRHGLPQLVVPSGADQFGNAEALERRGVALVVHDFAVTAESIRSLLAGGALSDAASDVRREISGMPTPADVVPRLEALVG